MHKYRKRWFLGLSLLLCFHNIEVEPKKILQTQKGSPVEVRAVFINCETSGGPENPDSPSLRFERQELFKHNALRGCNKKLALTVKIASVDPAEVEYDKDNAEMGDEYIPIDHVFEGSDKKRVRLLNPYILRLRRELPKQAYKLHRIDTVSGVLTNSHSSRHADSMASKRQVQNRERRDLDLLEEQDENSVLLGSASSVFTLEHDNPNHQSYSVRIGRLQELIKAATPRKPENHDTTLDCGLRLYNTSTATPNNMRSSQFNQNSKSIVLYESDMTKDKRDVCPRANSSRDRRKRQKQVMMTILDEVEIVTPKYQKGHHYHPKSIRNRKNYSLDVDERQNRDLEFNKETSVRDEVSEKVDAPKHSNTKPKDRSQHSESVQSKKLPKRKENSDKNAEDIPNDKNLIRTEREFAVYEIGNPNLWYDIRVHLFEKLSTPEGKTVWNDLTKGEDASVSSANPEWKGQDVNVRYRPAEWVPRDDFTLPMTKLCLLEPLRDNITIFEDEPQELNAEAQNYIVVPLEDVVYVDDKMNLKKRDDNLTSATSNEQNIDINGPGPRRVEVRVSRAIMGSGAENFDIACLGADRFLTLPHRRPHHSQIDVEVRADDNLLVRVGGVIRECGPEVSTLIKQKGSEEISSEPIILPPHHTRRLKLEVPVEIPIDVTHCNVALVNDEDESVAVRDVVIKKGDRCFCVWHCECVCLSEDPKLLCREMSRPQQVAAGLSTTSERRARSICYMDNMKLDFFSVLIGVLIFLTLLGLIKAFIGLWNVTAGQVGWRLVLCTPITLNCYYEPCLRERNVVYMDGWPVHPDTKKPTVRALSCPASFLLNLVFFIVIPCIAIHGIVKAAIKLCRGVYWKARCKVRKVDEQVFSAHDLQGESLELIVRRKRKHTLSDWMTPFAKELTADVLKNAMEPALADCQNEEMQPLLHEGKLSRSEGKQSAVPDSEQEDTEYVLMQMQKSRESLARSQKKFNDSVHSTEKNISQTKGDSTAATSKN